MKPNNTRSCTLEGITSLLCFIIGAGIGLFGNVASGLLLICLGWMILLYIRIESLHDKMDYSIRTFCDLLIDLRFDHRLVAQDIIESCSCKKHSKRSFGAGSEASLKINKRQK